jgi:glycosyltransferase involved in cell wall biosynthesis
MKIALLSFEYPPDTGFGGIGTYTWYQARALAKLGNQVHVLAGASDSSTLHRTEHDGVVVYRFSDRLVGELFRRVGRHRLIWTKSRLRNALNMYRMFRWLSRQHHYDVVEMPECGGEGVLVNHFTRIPSVVRLHSPAYLIMPTYGSQKTDRSLCAMVEGWGIRGATALTSCSRFVAGEVHSKMGVQRPITVIPNGIDVELFNATPQADVRGKLQIPRDKTMILFSGRMESRESICAKTLPLPSLSDMSGLPSSLREATRSTTCRIRCYPT